MSDSEKTDLPAGTKETTETLEKKTEDPELDELLDDALEGFDKPAGATAESASRPGLSSEPEKSVKDVVWSEEFLKQASEEFEKNIKSMMASGGLEEGGDNTKFAESLFKMSQQAAGKVFNTDLDVGASLADTLKSLAEGAEALQGGDEETLASLLEKMAMGESGAESDAPFSGLDDLFPAMQGMLQSLLSKELLYPSMKDITNKYPDWLADNRDKLDEASFEKYNKQFSLMQQVCVEFEGEAESDSQEVKQVRFEKIMSLMQQMQECGHPPKELAGDMPPNPLESLGMGFDPSQNPSPDSCSIM